MSGKLNVEVVQVANVAYLGVWNFVVNCIYEKGFSALFYFIF